MKQSEEKKGTQSAECINQWGSLDNVLSESLRVGEYFQYDRSFCCICLVATVMKFLTHYFLKLSNKGES